jgi:hypothetical protein
MYAALPILVAISLPSLYKTSHPKNEKKNNGEKQRITEK